MNSQLVWGGILTGQEIVSMEDTMGGVPYGGGLRVIADDAVARAAWGVEGALETVYTTPFGDVPGSAVVNFPSIHALAYSWDLVEAMGNSIEFTPEKIPGISAVVAAACTDATRDMGLFGATAEACADATATEQLMAAAGRTIKR